MFKIIPQIEKCFKVETEVLARHIKFFPMHKGGNLSFGKLKFLVVSMLLECQQTKKIHKLTWSAYSCKQGSFKWHQPDYVAHPILKGIDKRPVLDGKGRTVPDVLAEPITHKGDTVSFATHEDMLREFVRMTGEDTTIEILNAFTDRISQLYADRAETMTVQAEI